MRHSFPSASAAAGRDSSTNLVERWFRDLADERVRRGVYRNVPQLIDVIQDYIDHHNDTDRDFVWTAKAEDVLAKVRRARAVLDKSPTA